MTQDLTTDQIFDLPTHAAADAFPMLPEDELVELAADIQDNGLRDALVLQEIEGETVLVDGRNRREACRRAGITPTVRYLNGEDPSAYIVSTNVTRRHMTKGQRAMCVARIYPEPEKGGRGRKSSKIEGITAGYLSMARAVLKHAPDLVDLVIAGEEVLSKAYEEAMVNKGKDEAAAGIQTRRMERIQTEDLDLYARVTEETMTAEEILKERAYQWSVHCNAMNLALQSIMSGAIHLRHERADHQLQEYIDFLTQHPEDFKVATVDSAEEGIEALRDIARNSARLIELLDQHEEKP